MLPRADATLGSTDIRIANFKLFHIEWLPEVWRKNERTRKRFKLRIVSVERSS
jgi:hypothetical protein